ncbi:hypothetical protein [Clostridium tetani]|uniref:Uncharacterized protein n=1 Tax=Clostridium tetani TaxID=1513 RepID=A0ABC8EDP0_CLOTA|nr:hypothetical protein [Clostridium tetani]BDR81066.1 hypothetical protein K234311028_13120 [Clostridium tetani]
MKFKQDVVTKDIDKIIESYIYKNILDLNKVNIDDIGEIMVNKNKDVKS